MNLKICSKDWGHFEGIWGNPGEILGKYCILDVNSGKVRGGHKVLVVCTQEGGGGHSSPYTVQRGGWGGSRNWEKMRM